MSSRPHSGPNYLLASIPLWIAAVLLGAYLLFGRGGGDDGPTVVFSATQVLPTPTATAAPPTATPTTPSEPSPTATSAAPTPTLEPATYTVQAGDTLTQICNTQRPNVPDCQQQVVTLNGLPGANQISLGQELILPPSP